MSHENALPKHNLEAETVEGHSRLITVLGSLPFLLLIGVILSLGIAAWADHPRFSTFAIASIEGPVLFFLGWWMRGNQNKKDGT